MSLVKSIIAGLIGGAIGAAVWFGIAYGANREFAWIAWGVGALVGVFVRVGAGNDAGAASGLIAVVLSLASIAAGKYATVHMIVGKEAARVEAQIAAELAKPMTDDDAVMEIGDQLLTKAEQDGKTLKWPKGKDAESDRESINDFPSDIAKDAKARWKGMSDTEKQTYKDDTMKNRAAMVKAAMAGARSAAEHEGFVGMFDGFDILFAVLAMVSAFKIGSDSAD
jgi:hypothetical protein